MCHWALQEAQVSLDSEGSEGISGQSPCLCKGVEAGKHLARASENLLCGYSVISESCEGGLGHGDDFHVTQPGHPSLIPVPQRSKTSESEPASSTMGQCGSRGAEPEGAICSPYPASGSVWLIDLATSPAGP